MNAAIRLNDAFGAGTSGLSPRQRALGAYLGFAVGDALGAPIEFLTAREIAHKHGVVNTMLGGGWLKLKPGQTTDDTDMCLILGRSLLASAEWNPHTAAEGFVAWLKSRPVDIGNTCRRGIQRYMMQGTLEGLENQGDGGNGACMRILPMALARLHDAESFERDALLHSHLTHHHPFSDAGTLTYGHMIRTLVQANSLDPKSAVRVLADQLVAKHKQFRFDPYPGRASGYIVDTLQTVFHGFFTSDSFEDCVVSVANRGEDADTTAALAGGLAGALHGPAAIPRHWLDKLDPKLVAEIEQQVTGLMRGS